MRVKLKDACIVTIYIFVFIAAVTYMQYTLDEYSVWRLLYRGTVFCILGFCIFYFILVIRTKYLRITSIPILLGSFLTYIVFVSAVRHIPDYQVFLIDAIPWIALILVFYHYSKKYELPSVFKPITAVGILLICALSIPNILRHIRYIDGNAIFATYYCIAFLPMLYYCFDSKKMILTFNVIVVFLMLLSLKRAAFIISIAGVGAYYMLNYHNENTSKRKLWSFFGLLAAAVLFVFLGRYIIERLNLSIIERLSNMLEDGGSGREKIWETVLNEFHTSSGQQKLLGHGFHAVYYDVKPLGIARYAHNSWIEFLYDYGIIGVVFLALFVIKILLQTYTLIVHRNPMSSIMAYSCILMLVLSSVSYFFDESTIILPVCVIWGICLGKLSGQQKRRSRMRLKR